MTLSFTVSDRFREAAAEWGDSRLMDEGDALEAKAEQALLEIEHLVSGASEVEFAVDGDTVHHEASDELESFLEAQAAEAGVEPGTLLGLHVDLFASVFLESDQSKPGRHPDDPRP